MNKNRFIDNEFYANSEHFQWLSHFYWLSHFRSSSQLICWKSSIFACKPVAISLEMFGYLFVDVKYIASNPTCCCVYLWFGLHQTAPRMYDAHVKSLTKWKSMKCEIVWVCAHFKNLCRTNGVCAHVNTITNGRHYRQQYHSNVSVCASMNWWKSIWWIYDLSFYHSNKWLKLPQFHSAATVSLPPGHQPNRW